MSYYNLLSKCDRALVAHLVAQGAGTVYDVLPAKLSLDKSAPCTICFCDGARELVPYSGVYTVRAQIIVKTLGVVDYGESDTDAKDASEARVAAAFDAFHLDFEQDGALLAETITTAARSLGGDLADFTIQNVELESFDQGQDDKASAWIDTLELKLTACPKDVS
jgi:hypothetical protein